MPGPTLKFGEPESGTQHIEVDAQYDAYVDAKRGTCGHWHSRELQQQLEPITGIWLARIGEADQPGLLAGANSLDDMVQRIQEDFVIMHRDPYSSATGARAVYVNASFPSGWCPQCTTGMTFMRIHAPVPNADQFGGSGRKEAAVSLFSGEQLVRFIWSLIPDNTLDRRRCQRTGDDVARHASPRFSWADAEQLWLRVERQVIAPIDERTSCFLIRIYHYAIDEFSEPEICLIRDALASMPAAVRRYKGLPEDLDLRLSGVNPAPML